MTKMATFYLDLAPSVNAMYRNVPKVGRVKTSAYTSWVKNALNELIAQKARPVTPPVAITIELPETMRGDLDGRLKGTIDLMVKAGVVPDDNRRYVRSVAASFYEGKRMRITVQSLRGEE
jgi:Holliday junction resolvase RusA-like endonuclease